MSIFAGGRLGPYEILERVGAGGMGEVWKARDTRLNRTVAIKVSGDRFSDRFAREARAVAALNHPHICTLYDVGPDYLVMEFIDGAPLRGPLPQDRAVEYAKQILDALEHAHKLGITHRDLKPGNILLTKKGIKLLDFGLARVEDGSGDSALTQSGQVMGTPAYMAPEQWEGQRGDARSDIYSFGCVLHETLTGKRAAEERSAMASPGMDRVVKTCLAKDPDARWQSAHDLNVALDLAVRETAPVPARRWRERLAWASAFVLALALVSVVFRGPQAPPGRVVDFHIDPPEAAVFSGPIEATVGPPQFALSPDERAVAFVATTAGANPVLWIQYFNELKPRLLIGTDGAMYPFWSPVGEYIGFFAEGALKKVSAAGGPVRVVAANIVDPRGGTWGAENTILIGTGSDSILKVNSEDGAVTPVTKLGSADGSHRWPHFLPDGNHFLFGIRTQSEERRGVYIGTLNGAISKLIGGEDPTTIRYVAPGFLLVMQGDTLVARAFDLSRLAFFDGGQSFVVAEHVGRSSNGYSSFSSSISGAVAWAGPNRESGRLIRYDKAGTAHGPVGPGLGIGDYIDFRFSHDEKRLAYSLVDEKLGVPEIWIADLATGAPFQLTNGPALNSAPIWSADDSGIFFKSTRRGGFVEFYKRSSAGGGMDEEVLTAAMQRTGGQLTVNTASPDLSPNGKDMLYANASAGSGEIWSLSLDEPFAKRTPHLVLRSNTAIVDPSFSPKDPFFTYATVVAGKMQVFLETFPKSDKKWPISTDGGYEPRWSEDGRTLYYLSLDRKLMAVAIGPNGPLGGKPPVELFQTKVASGITLNRRHYVVMRDGFVIKDNVGESAPTPIMVELNWMARLKR